MKTCCAVVLIGILFVLITAFADPVSLNAQTELNDRCCLPITEDPPSWPECTGVECSAGAGCPVGTRCAALTGGYCFDQDDKYCKDDNSNTITTKNYKCESYVATCAGPPPFVGEKCHLVEAGQCHPKPKCITFEGDANQCTVGGGQ